MRDPFTTDPTSPYFGGVTRSCADLVPVYPSDDAGLGFTATGLFATRGGFATIETAAGTTRTIEIAGGGSEILVGVSRVFLTRTARSNEADPSIQADPTQPDYEPWLFAMKAYRG
ncbi:hypothetical protein [Tropicimonas sp. IMCC34043]|uniref:spike base protein, RCAP_Rcc01079 family n=1 Tax=Tropicimonas sp. IMCC34043 TaxID=2248760 RepID=UPI000E281A67|nr:hypothetical protein [Tropicimonas sp. IMCC34043]